MAKGKLALGLQRYYAAVNEAKRIGGEYAKYVDKYFKMSRRLRKKGVKIKSTGARVLNYESFMIDTHSETSNIDKLIAKQFGLISGNQARVLQARLQEAGYNYVSLQRAMTRQLSPGEWNVIDAYYHELKSQGVKDAGAELAIYFFGS